MRVSARCRQCMVRWFDCTARWLMSVRLRIFMVRNLLKQQPSNCTLQRMLSAVSERRTRVAVGRVGGHRAEPVVRLCHALYHAARRRQAWSHAGDAPSFYLPEKEFFDERPEVPRLP